jgi:hypothetical protein
MKIANATKLNRKSGVAEWRDLRFLFFALERSVHDPTTVDVEGLARHGIA